MGDISKIARLSSLTQGSGRHSPQGLKAITKSAGAKGDDIFRDLVISTEWEISQRSLVATLQRDDKVREFIATGNFKMNRHCKRKSVKPCRVQAIVRGLFECSAGITYLI